MSNPTNSLNQCANTDKEIWREREGDYYADSIHVTENGGIGINCGGSVVVMPVRKWFELAGSPTPSAAQEQAQSNSTLIDCPYPETVYLADPHIQQNIHGHKQTVGMFLTDKPDGGIAYEYRRVDQRGEISGNAHREFFDKIWTKFCEGEFGEEGDEVAAIAVKLGLATEEKYDPTVHGDFMAQEWGMEEGDHCYVKAKTQSAREIVALPDWLMGSAQALLDMDAANTLAPHAIGGHARDIIEAFIKAHKS